ncbi:5761_t:CDS:2, partial [Gigaspora margarita]
QEIKKLEGTEIGNIIRQYLTISLKLQDYFQSAASSSQTQVLGSATDNLSHIITPSTVHSVEEIRNNQIEEEQMVVRYDVPKYESADKHKHKETIK